MPSSNPSTGPLAGVRVLDLSNVYSGPMATAMLADQGAIVTKVESPEGDTSRSVGPKKGDISACFITTNRGKRSIALNLKQADAQAVLHALVQHNEVLVDNFRPGVMARIGLDQATLARLNPSLVQLSITGFGPDGPRADDRAYDAVIQAVSGFSASHRDKHTGAPALVSTTVCDKLTALTAAQAVTAALFARSRDGRGRRVEVSMLDAALAFQWIDAMYNHVFLDDAPQPFPAAGITLKPYATADGMVALMAPQQAEFIAVCKAAGHPEVAEDPRFVSLQTRGRHPRELRAALEPLIAQIPTAEFEARARQFGAPVGRVNELDQVLTDPQVLHNASVVQLDHGELGRVQLARAAARFDGQALGPRGPAPHLSQQAGEILREIGLVDAQIQALVACGALRLN